MEAQDARPEDHATLVGWIQQYYAFDHIPFRREEVEAGLRLLLATPALGAAWLFRQEGHVVGYSIATYSFDIEFGGRMAIVTDFFLDPARRRQGLGTLALTAIEAALRERGVGAIELQVERDNVEAQGFYKKIGFRELDRNIMSKRI